MACPFEYFVMFLRRVDEEFLIEEVAEMKLSKCKVCGCEPFVHKTRVMALGGSFDAYCVECTFDDEQDSLPFVEHDLCVYGNTEKEADDRWNELNKK